MALRHLEETVRSKLRSGVAITCLAQCVIELVDNSIDAGATCVAVRVDVNRFKVQVVDNGRGVSQNDLGLIGERYVTSKCHSLQDLDHNLQHLGYRGEALASIVNVSGMVEIFSRHQLSQQTFSKVFQNGKAVGVVASNSPRPSVGTTITVHDFFHNMPVRRKTMLETLELEQVRRAVENIALINPSISFSVRNDTTGSCILQTHRTHSVLSNFGLLFASSMVGKMKDVSISHSCFNISGFISTDTHHSKNLQFIYVNKRILKKTPLHNCVNHQLSNSLLTKRLSRQHSDSSNTSMKISSPTRTLDRYPVYVLMIECPRSEYDICLEPAKTLVEFKHWDNVLSGLASLSKKFLEQNNLTLGLVPTSTASTTQSVQQTTEPSVCSVIPDVSQDTLEKQRLSMPTLQSRSVKRPRLIKHALTTAKASLGDSPDLQFSLPDSSGHLNNGMPPRTKGNESLNLEHHPTSVFSEMSCGDMVSVGQSVHTTKIGEDQRSHNLSASDRGESPLCRTQAIKTSDASNYQQKNTIQHQSCNTDSLTSHFTTPHQLGTLSHTQTNSLYQTPSSFPQFSSPINQQPNSLFVVPYNPHKQSQTHPATDIYPRIYQTPELDATLDSPLLQSTRPTTQTHYPSISRSTHVHSSLRSSTVSAKLASMIKGQTAGECSQTTKSVSAFALVTPEILTALPTNELNIQPDTCEPLHRSTPCPPDGTAQAQNPVTGYSTTTIGRDSHYLPNSQTTSNLLLGVSARRSTEYNSTQSKSEHGGSLDQSLASSVSHFDSGISLSFRKPSNPVIMNSCLQPTSVDSSPQNDISRDDLTSKSSISDTTARKPLWKEIYDPITGRKLFIHSITGNTSYKKPTISLMNRSPSSIIDKSSLDSAFDESADTLLVSNALSASQSTTLGTRPLRAAPHLSHDYQSFVPRPRHQRTANININSGKVSELVSEHRSMPTGDTTVSKWRDKNELDALALAENCGDVCGNSFSTLLENWRNPTFQGGQEDVADIGSGSGSRAQIKVHSVINKYRFTKEMFDNVTVLGQIDNKFIACMMNKEKGGVASKNLLVMVDQHAAHERVRLEQLVDDLYDSTVVPRRVKTSKIYPDLILDLPSSDVQLARHFKRHLEKIGVTISVDCEGKLLVSTLPLVFMEREVSEVKRGRPAVAVNILQEMILKHLELLQATGGGSASIPVAITRVLNSQACHGAIKFGDPLTFAECEALIQSLSKCKLPFQCAHGRPALVPVLDIDILIKRFPPNQVMTFPKLHQLASNVLS